MAISPDVWRAEPAFHLDDFLALQVPESLKQQSYDFLTRQVGRKPENLALHVCRIKAAAFHNGEAVFGSLVDLLWILKNRGRPLQQRMLMAARKWLPTEYQETLHRYLVGQLTLQSIPFSPSSLFQEGVWGEVLFLNELPGDKSSSYDQVVVAKECLEAGQLDQAMEMLEDVLIQTPEITVVRQELLEIYQATNEAERFWCSYGHLEAKGISDSAWRETAEWFKAQGL